MVLGILYNFICEEGAIPRRSASSVGNFLAEKIFFRFFEQNSETEAFFAEEVTHLMWTKLSL